MEEKTNENTEVAENSALQNEDKQEVSAEQVIADKNAGVVVKKERILSIDRFRGFCMFLMACSFIFPLFSCFDFLAPVVEHGDKGFQILPGISFADLFAAMFIFVIGLTICKSIKDFKFCLEFLLPICLPQCSSLLLALQFAKALKQGKKNLEQQEHISNLR